MSDILWLASYPKSGNTWLRAFLHNLFRNPDTPFDINRMSELTRGRQPGPVVQTTRCAWRGGAEPGRSRASQARGARADRRERAGYRHRQDPQRARRGGRRAHDHPVTDGRRDLRRAQPPRRGPFLCPSPGPAGGRHHHADGDRGLRDGPRPNTRCPSITATGPPMWRAGPAGRTSSSTSYATRT